MERCPVSIAGTRDLDDGALVQRVESLVDESIYDEPGRLAQPDEVWNFGRGDGAEKALLLGNVLRARHPDAHLTIEVTSGSATLFASDDVYRFVSHKGLRTQTWHLDL